MSTVKPPATLCDAGVSLWAGITSKYALRPDELAVLEDACAATDMVAALEQAWVDDGKPMTTKGSMGQQVIHPLIGEMRAQRAARDAALARLKLPDMPAAGFGTGSQSDASGKARAAAAARWSNGA